MCMLLHTWTGRTSCCTSLWYCNLLSLDLAALSRLRTCTSRCSSSHALSERQQHHRQLPAAYPACFLFDTSPPLFLILHQRVQRRHNLRATSWVGASVLRDMVQVQTTHLLVTRYAVPRCSFHGYGSAQQLCTTYAIRLRAKHVRSSIALGVPSHPSAARWTIRNNEVLQRRTEILLAW
jgi:hypothetical protein